MPAALRATLDWLEQVGAIIETPRGPCGTLYPAAVDLPHDRLSEVAFHIPDPSEALWPQAPQDIGERLSLFIMTGGDGSHAGFWIDDDGRQQVVHLGSGSGSLWIDTVTDNILDFLRVLAIGYKEPAFDACHVLTPLEDDLNLRGVTPDDPRARDPALQDRITVPPLAYRAFLIERFGITIPERACEIIPSPCGRHDRPPSAFARWAFPGVQQD